MGLMKLLFGGGAKSVGTAVSGVVEVFKPNAEKAAQRADQYKAATLNQYASEFRHNKNWFDSLVDGANRLPRPLMALGVLALFVSAMTDPIWFASRMQGLALVPEPLWWLLGAVVSFYFGAREVSKTRDWKASINQSIDYAPKVIANIKELQKLRHDSVGAAASDDPDVVLAENGDNPVIKKLVGAK